MKQRNSLKRKRILKNPGSNSELGGIDVQVLSLLLPCSCATTTPVQRDILAGSPDRIFHVYDKKEHKQIFLIAKGSL